MAKAAAQAGSVGKNIEWKIVGNKLTLEVDLTGDTTESKSGKTLILASSQGNKTVGDVHVGLNVYRYASSKKEKK